jgi:hypothetical protein
MSFDIRYQASYIRQQIPLRAEGSINLAAMLLASKLFIEVELIHSRAERISRIFEPATLILQSIKICQPFLVGKIDHHNIIFGISIERHIPLAIPFQFIVPHEGVTLGAPMHQVQGHIFLVFRWLVLGRLLAGVGFAQRHVKVHQLVLVGLLLVENVTVNYSHVHRDFVFF